jgi:probable FeS assembly SUF system protein SufT
MESLSSVELTRDCDATQIPGGNQVMLPAKALVEIVQTLGGHFTVRAEGGLYRIASRDADALGRQSTGAVESGSASSPPAESGDVISEELVWNALRTCYDPEIPVNIVDLGLVYDLQVKLLASGQSRVDAKMTLTAMGCGMGATIAGDAEQKLLEIPGVSEASVQIVWDPPWHHSMISPMGRAKLGLD